MPNPASPACLELPDEIEEAIEDYWKEALFYALAPISSKDLHMAGVRGAYDALTTAILSRLSAAEAGRVRLQKDRLDWVSATFHEEDRAVAAEAARDAALARVERLEKALKEAADWHESAADDLDGLPQNSHTRWWRSIHSQRSDEIRSALSDPSLSDLKETREGAKP